MSEPSREHQQLPDDPSDVQSTGPEGHGSLTVEDDPAGTEDPADLAGTANSDDEPVGPTAHE